MTDDEEEAHTGDMQGNQGHENHWPNRNDPHVPTRMKANRNWSYRGDNTKYKEKK